MGGIPNSGPNGITTCIDGLWDITVQFLFKIKPILCIHLKFFGDMHNVILAINLANCR